MAQIKVENDSDQEDNLLSGKSGHNKCVGFFKNKGDKLGGTTLFLGGLSALGGLVWFLSSLEKCGFLNPANSTDVNGTSTNPPVATCAGEYSLMGVGLVAVLVGAAWLTARKVKECKEDSYEEISSATPM